MTVAELDRLPPTEAALTLQSCCGATRWIEGMLARRPFGSLDRVRTSARSAWEALGEADWREAFAHHPRIGEVPADQPWPAQEQSGVSTATRAIQDELARMNRAYEQRFGFIYLVCASGRSAEELLAIVRDRIDNDADSELRNAAAEQLKITLLRVDRLLSEGA